MKSFVVFCGCGTWSLALRRDCGCLRTGCWGLGNIWPCVTGSDRRAGQNNAVRSSINVVFTKPQVPPGVIIVYLWSLGKCLDLISEMGAPTCLPGIVVMNRLRRMACSTHGRDKKCAQKFRWEPQHKRLHGELMLRWQDNIKMCLNSRVCSL
jgi:hypothetical protein